MRTVILRFASVAAVVLMLAAFSQPALAGEAVQGTVVSVQSNAIVLTTADSGEQTTVPIDEDTRVTIDGKEAQVSELKTGMTVSVSAFEDEAADQIAASSQSSGGFGQPEE